MDRPTVHPGTVSSELLMLHVGHRSSHIWDGDLLTQKFHPRHINNFWELIREHTLYHCTIECLTRTGFYRVVDIRWLQFDWPLITTLIECWRLETLSYVDIMLHCQCWHHAALSNLVPHCYFHLWMVVPHCHSQLWRVLHCLTYQCCCHSH